MDIRQRADHRQKQVLNQSLVQSARLLELPLPELRALIDEELEQNPVLEEEAKAESLPEIPQTLPEAGENRLDAAQDGEETDNPEKPLPGRRESLHDHLSRQLRINTNDEERLKIGMALIRQIDENGYLRIPLNAIIAEIGAPQEHVENTLRLIQTFDPAGIGARDLKECLLLQLDRSDHKDGLLRTLISDHLEDLAQGQWAKLAKTLKCTDEALKDMVLKIHALEPKPGRGYSSEETVYVIPDISVEEKDDRLVVVTNDESLPLLRINPTYRAMLRNKKIDDKTKDFIRQKIANGNNLMSAIQNRRQMLGRVMELVMSIQKDALTDGFEKLKPLSLKEVAETTHIHESTISRVVMNKYVQTPAGIFPLRKFFSTGLKTTNGEDVSSQSIQLKIQELIDAEDKQKPLKDQDLVVLLKKNGNIEVARRTVVKYREAMKIPSAPKRRKATPIPLTRPENAT